MEQIVGDINGGRGEKVPALIFLLLLIVCFEGTFRNKFQLVFFPRLQCFIFKRSLVCMCKSRSCTGQFRIQFRI